MPTQFQPMPLQKRRLPRISIRTASRDRKWLSLARPDRISRNRKGLALGFTLSTMDLPGDYKPKMGDIVTSRDHAGIYKVLSVTRSGMTDLQFFDVATQELIGTVRKNIPCSHLQRFAKDARQAAVRLIKEATKV